MKLIDKNGRLFGKISVIDVVAVSYTHLRGRENSFSVMPTPRRPLPAMPPERITR